MIYNSIGCFYNRDKTAIVTAKKTKDETTNAEKVILNCDEFNNPDFEEILKKINDFFSINKICTNKNEPLLVHFQERIKQIDLDNDKESYALIDIYQSLLNKDLLIINDSLDVKKQHHFKALQLALSGLDYYQPKNYLL